MDKNSVTVYKDCKQNLDEYKSWVSFEFTNNEKISFDEIELRCITKTIKRILKIKDFFCLNFLKKKE